MSSSEPLIGIVGGGVAGLRAANALLAREVDARVVLFGDEAHRTYSRPGLTKRRYPSADALDRAMTEELQVRGVENSALTWRLDTRVEAADLRGRTLRLSTGDRWRYDALVVATGVRPRTMAGSGSACALHTHRTLRGLDDARYLHDELRRGRKVTIAGAGFVACELASLAVRYGCEVVLLETRRHGPFESVLGRRVATALRYWMSEKGVTFLTGEPAKRRLCDRVTSSSGAANATESQEPEQATDRPLFIEAIGSVPNAEWLRGNGLDLSDGVRVDAYMRVPGIDRVFAAGDIARYPDPWEPEKFTRMEFWKNAVDTGDIAGRSVAVSLGYDAKISPVRYFPSATTEIFDLRVQVAGNSKLSDSAEIACGSLDRLEEGVIVTYLRDKELVGAAYLDKGARLNRDYIELLAKLKAR